MSPTVRRAGPDDLDLLAPLFDAYRRFYTGRDDAAVSRSFLGERLSPTAWAGLALVLVGVFAMTLPERRPPAS